MTLRGSETRQQTIQITMKISEKLHQSKGVDNKHSFLLTSSIFAVGGRPSTCGTIV